MKQNAFFVSMNLLSIAVAFALCTIGYFNYQFNADFNEYFPNANNILKINAQKNSAGAGLIMGATPLPLANSVQEDFAGLSAARYTSSDQYVKLGADLFRQRAAFVDKSFLEIFRFKLITGQQARFETNHEIFISERTKRKLFGERKAQGESLELVLEKGERLLLTIAGVLEEMPENTSFSFDFIIPFENYLNINGIDRYDWSHWVEATFIEKPTATQQHDVAALLDKYLPNQNKMNREQEIANYEAANILEWGSIEPSLYKSNFRGVLHPASVVGTISSALAVLLLAIFNFINTSLAMSRKRLREIGVRKVIGGGRLDLRIQFLAESLAQIFIALLISGVITYYLSNAYNSMFPFDIVEFDRVSMGPFITFMLAVWFCTGLTSGIYPALYVSKFKAVDILKSKVKFSRKNLFVKSLITIQFAVCIYNVFALLVFVQNTIYQDKLDRGYNVAGSINVPISEESKFKVLKAKLESQLEIQEVTGTVQPIGFGVQEIVVEYLSNDLDVSSIKVGGSYLESLDVQLVDGAFFKTSEGSVHDVIINEMLSKQLGGEVLNNWIHYEGMRYRVVGIVKNFNLKPIMLNNKIQPTVIFYSPEKDYKYININLASKDVHKIDAKVEKIWKELYPDEMYISFLQQDVLRAVDETNNIMLSINSFVAIIIILITAIGLYAQVSLNTQSRIKEFGIRKVLGAPIRNILYLINKEVVIMLLIACVLGLVGGEVAISAVMDIVYAYHKEIEVENFIWPVIVVFAIMFISIANIVFKAAKVNPVEQLRAE